MEPGGPAQPAFQPGARHRQRPPSPGGPMSPVFWPAELRPPQGELGCTPRAPPREKLRPVVGGRLSARGTTLSLAQSQRREPVQPRAGARSRNQPGPRWGRGGASTAPKPTPYQEAWKQLSELARAWTRGRGRSGPATGWGRGRGRPEAPPGPAPPPRARGTRGPTRRTSLGEWGARPRKGREPRAPRPALHLPLCPCLPGRSVGAPPGLQASPGRLPPGGGLVFSTVRLENSGQCTSKAKPLQSRLCEPQ